MPKKWKGGINEKSETTRQRRAEQKAQKKAADFKQKEDSQWEETDAKVLRKLREKEERARKEEERRLRKQELKEAAAREQEEIAQSLRGKGKHVEVTKITRKQIDEAHSRQQAEEERERKRMEKEMTDTHHGYGVAEIDDLSGPSLRELNVAAAAAREEGHILASTLNQAVDDMALVDGGGEQHPEKRMKAAYKAYEERMLPQMKRENPSLRRTQLKEILWKEWQSSPENPRNKPDVNPLIKKGRR